MTCANALALRLAEQQVLSIWFGYLGTDPEVWCDATPRKHWQISERAWRFISFKDASDYSERLVPLKTPKPLVRGTVRRAHDGPEIAIRRTELQDDRPSAHSLAEFCRLNVAPVAPRIDAEVAPQVWPQKRSRLPLARIRGGNQREERLDLITCQGANRLIINLRRTNHRERQFGRAKIRLVCAVMRGVGYPNTGHVWVKIGRTLSYGRSIHTGIASAARRVEDRHA